MDETLIGSSTITGSHGGATVELKKGSFLRTILILLGIGAVAYLVYYFFFKKSTYTLTEDITASVPVTGFNILKTATASPVTNNIIIKKGTVLTGTENENTKVFTASLASFGSPTMLDIPMSKISKTKPFWPLF